MARNENALSRPACARASSKATALLCAAALACPWAIAPQPAVAEDIETDPQPDELQQAVERTAAELEEAKAQVEAAKASIEDKRVQLQEIESLLPAQQAQSDAAARELYKIQQEMPGIVDLLLASDSFFDFMANLEYVNRVSEANRAEINRLTEMKSELDTTTEELEQAKADAEERAIEAEQALAAAQEARLEAQRKAQEAARQEAEAAAAASAAATAAANAQNGNHPDSPDTPGSQEEAAAQPAPVATPVDDGADWTEDEAAFIANWAPRIDAYLAGSPLAGQGTTFARAAWEYGVDPRWSPAISFTESTKGQYCFLPHNAWGWGSVSWDSWEEAINDHVRGLARGYGYTISMEAARKYCPPNAELWYERTLSQMNQI